RNLLLRPTVSITNETTTLRSKLKKPGKSLSVSRAYARRDETPSQSFYPRSVTAATLLQLGRLRRSVQTRRFCRRNPQAHSLFACFYFRKGIYVFYILAKTAGICQVYPEL